jgi:hypothetical protein
MGFNSLNWQVQELMNKNVDESYTATDLRFCTKMVLKSELTLSGWIRSRQGEHGRHGGQGFSYRNLA